MELRGEDEGEAFNRFVEKSRDSCPGNPVDTPPPLLSTSIASKSAGSGAAVVAIVGPTGSGKSELALFIAENCAGEIINCDSVQVYRGLDVGSAKTPVEDRRGIPHHLLDILSSTEQLSAGEYARLARSAVHSVLNRKRLPIVVGGTGFYLRALFDGLPPAPGRDVQLRKRLEAVRQRKPAVLHRYLRWFDPVRAMRIHPNDAQKLIRAIELTRLLRRPPSTIRDQPRDLFHGVRPLMLGLNPDRRLLYERLNRRTEWMFANGLLPETEQLMSQMRDEAPRALASVGYRQAVDYLKGRLTLTDAIEEASMRTRQYAKRQLTWFRADARIKWLAGFGSDVVVQETALTRVIAHCSLIDSR